MVSVEEEIDKLQVWLNSNIVEKRGEQLPVRMILRVYPDWILGDIRLYCAIRKIYGERVQQRNGLLVIQNASFVVEKLIERIEQLEGLLLNVIRTLVSDGTPLSSI
jgi:hypothetical protein